MADSERGRLRAVAWTEILPWLSLFRTFRLAIGPRMLVLSAMAILLTAMGWTIVSKVFSGTDDTALIQRIGGMAPAEECPWLLITNSVPNRPICFDEDSDTNSNMPSGTSIGPVPLPGQIAIVAQGLSRPFSGIFSERATFQSLSYCLLTGLWVLLVWAVFGAAITRTAAVQLAVREQVSWGAMLGHVRARWKDYCGAPLIPLIAVLGITLLMLVAGLLLRSGPTLWLAAIAWPLMLVGGGVMAVVLLGLMFGWPLMWATISSEGTDAFDGLSRGYSYVLQRPLHYLFYVVVAGLFGALGWLLVSNFAAGIVYLTYWAASWGCGQELITDIMSGSESLDAVAGSGATLIRFWVGCVKLVAVGFLYSYFWTASTAIYFLLRRDVDATEMDEVYLDDNDDGQAYGLPPITRDAQGAPVVNDTPTDPPAPMPDEPETPPAE
ncbi:MAG: hypothetical protein JW818_08555 [Pirellulales bacterium]|nr:hypothetical protein [Pirellulales bacterium]